MFQEDDVEMMEDTTNCELIIKDEPLDEINEFEEAQVEEEENETQNYFEGRYQVYACNKYTYIPCQYIPLWGKPAALP